MAKRDSLLLNGPITGLSSFALINRRLAAGLERAGYEVWPADASLPQRLAMPDVCLTHGHPYDARTAPGRTNLFFLEYEYARFTAADQPLADEIRARFDACLVPSHFVANAARASGIDIPIVLCPLGFDPQEFHPTAPPVTLPTTKRFRFVYVGGATERKGIDQLVDAYSAEFRHDDDVVLVLKTFSYDHLQPWFRDVRARVPSDGPEVIHVHGDEPSIAGYFTAADCGVFPFRGEGFALPVLECLASGTPVIVTEGGGPADYCTREHATTVRARQQMVDGKRQLEPDLAELRRHMRAAYERRGQPRDRAQIASSVSNWTWERTLTSLISAVEHCRLAQRAGAPRPTTQVTHVLGEKGPTSWKLVAAHLDTALTARFAASSFDQRSPMTALASRVVVAHSGFALQAFRVAADQPRPPMRVLVRLSGPAGSLRELVDRERALCGLERERRSEIEGWRLRQEERLADVLLVPSQAAARRYAAEGHPEHALRIVHLAFTAEPRLTLPRREKLRFLFAATDPFRKGLRILLEAWNALRPRNAELLCLVNTEVLRSQLVLRHLTRNPNIHLRPLVPHDQVATELAQAHCQLLPSFDEGFSVMVAEGMSRGVPAIVSDETGIAELLTHGSDGLIVPAGSVDALRDAIAELCDHPERLYAMGIQAYETSQRRPWSLFESDAAEVIAALMDEERA